MLFYLHPFLAGVGAKPPFVCANMYRQQLPPKSRLSAALWRQPYVTVTVTGKSIIKPGRDTRGETREVFEKGI